MKQLTKQQAIAIADSGAYASLSSEEKASFQLNQECLCMPFDVFHGAVEEAVGYPVFTHQFATMTDTLKADAAKNGVDLDAVYNKLVN